LILTGCGGTALPRITSQPSNQVVVVGQPATFSVEATSTSALTYQWKRGTAPIAGATSALYTTAATTLADANAQFSVVVTNSAGNTASDTATLTIAAGTDVLTYHNDNQRTGQNLTEAILTPENVNSARFGKIGFYALDGLVDAEPLFASSVAVPGGGTHNLLIAATENDSVYAIDADSGATIWHVSVLKNGETTAPDLSRPTFPNVGVNPTPVIDRSSGPNGAIYLVAASAVTQNGSITFYHRLHALDLALGTELFGGPVDIQATYPGTGDNTDGVNVIFDPRQYRERASLLLWNGVVYTSWASHYDVRPYTGWIIGYSESTLQQTTVLNITPNGNSGAIWMSGAGPAADSFGNIYLAVANGDFDTTLDANGFPANGDYGNSLMKLSTSGNQLSVADYFVMDNQAVENASDVDLGSGGPMVVPDLSDSGGRTVRLVVAAGKDTNLYVANRDSLGKFSVNNSNLYQELPAVLPGGVFSGPAFFNNTVYFSSVGGLLQAFPVTNAKLSTTASAQTANTFGYPGTTPSITANGTNNGIVWAVENWTPAVLHAYSPTNLNEIYNSNQASGGRDQFGTGNKFITPTIVNGKVFVGTTNGVAVFGLLPQQ
jgi:hypothetical protein